MLRNHGGRLMVAMLAVPLMVAAGVQAEAVEPELPDVPDVPGLPDVPDLPDAPDVPDVELEEPSYAYDFVSAPDFLNADVGDVSSAPGHRPGKPNSMNDSWRTAVDTTMDIFANEPGDDILVAGDLVMGHWGRDSKKTGIFGPTNSYKQRVRASRAAGNLYYSQWKERFTDRGLQVYPAIGDHEIGDNPWGRNKGKKRGFHRQRFNWHNFYDRKLNFSQNMLRGDKELLSAARPPGPASMTAYATRLHPEVLLVTLDVFKRTRNGVTAKLDQQQLRWLDYVLSLAEIEGIDWTIVQGHTPIATPVREFGSSAMTYRGGTNSTLWRLLKARNVDFYLNGEVHDVTATQPELDGPIQISHGGLIGFGGARYASIRLTDNEADIDMRRVSCRFNRSRGDRLWQTNSSKGPPAEIACADKPTHIGRMVVSADGEILGRTGRMTRYLPE